MEFVEFNSGQEGKVTIALDNIAWIRRAIKPYDTEGRGKTVIAFKRAAENARPYTEVDHSYESVKAFLIQAGHKFTSCPS